MLVKPEKKALILRSRNPNKILAVLPTARQLHVPYQGKHIDVIAVPHRTPEVQILRNIGVNAPSPVNYYYNWPGLHTPMKSQKETTAFLTLTQRGYCLDDMGTGKTRSVLWAYDFLRAERTVRRMLVIAPLSTLERVWADEIFVHFPHLTTSVLHGDKSKRKALLNLNSDIYVINHDGIKVILDDLIARKEIDLVVVDELSQVARSVGTDKWKALNQLTKHKRLWGLTGSPIPNGPTDAWAQCRLITPNTVPQYFSHWRAQTMFQVNQYKWKPRAAALEHVYKAMSPAIRHKRDECIDLPPMMYETRQTPLTAAQQKLYNQMLATKKAQFKAGEIVAVNAGVQAMKLVQIACGAAYGNGTTHFVLPANRIQTTIDVIQEAASKVIVFVPFTAALSQLADELGKQFSVAVIDGSVSKGNRDTIFSAFQRDADPHVIVAQPQAMSHGLTLTAASVVVWFAPITMADTYEQANARVSRPGQKHSQLVVHIESTAQEHKMYQALKEKTDMQATLLKMFAE